MSPAHAQVGELTTTKSKPSAAAYTSELTTTKPKPSAAAYTSEPTATKPKPSAAAYTSEPTATKPELSAMASAPTQEPITSKPPPSAAVPARGAIAQVAPDAPAPSGQPESVGVADGLAPVATHAGVDDVRLRELLEELRCLVCQNQSVYDSQADLAADLRGYVVDRMREGLSDDQIRSGLADRYGSFVLYRPPLSPSTWLLWLLPGLLLLAGLAILAVIIYRRSGQSPQPSSAPTDEIL
ncbi:MAG: cytochrome c-type biogenesis protein CcmH [Proteobacteria bacterium]|nr:cytochrome c-type biogenesis protein CcmH [Pseudomonadota bacterium]